MVKLRMAAAGVNAVGLIFPEGHLPAEEISIKPQTVRAVLEPPYSL